MTLAFPKGQKPGRIEKPDAKLRDPKYLRAYEGEACWGCGCQDETVVGAHIRPGEYAGRGSKPDDDLTIPLCAKCHKHCDEFPGNKYEPWVNLVLKNLARARYRIWSSHD
jgi:hypothetical protein